MTHRGIQQGDVALFHPGGPLARRLALTVGAAALRKAVILAMSAKRLGPTCVIDGDGRFQGTITDDDWRRAMEQTPDLSGRKARELMTRQPKIMEASTPTVEALAPMETFAITALLITDAAAKPMSVLRIHDLLKAGLM